MTARAVLIALVVGVVGAVLTVIGFVVDAHRAFFAYLDAYLYAFSVGFGALVLVLIGNAARARWFLLFRRIAEALAASLVVLTLLFIPILLGLHDLYPWTRPDTLHEQRLVRALHHEAPYLNAGFLIVRAVVYFALFLGCFFLLRRWSLRQDRDANPELGARQRAFSAAALPVVAFAFTFAIFDWLMALTPGWFSSVLPIYVWAGGFDAAIAIVILVERQAAPPGAGGAHYSALGRLLLAFVIFWAYIAYAQGFIDWIANKPAEVSWYVPRITGSWGTMGIVLIFVHFIVPFALLLPRAAKYSPAYLAVPAWIILVAHLVDTYWMVMPNLSPAGFAPSWIDAAALLGVLGLSFAAAGFASRGVPLVPENAPDLPIGLRYEPQP